MSAYEKPQDNRRRDATTSNPRTVPFRRNRTPHCTVFSHDASANVATPRVLVKPYPRYFLKIRHVGWFGLDLRAEFDPYTSVESRAAQPVGHRRPFEALSNEAQSRLRELMESLDPLGKLAAKARMSGRSVEAGGQRSEGGDGKAQIEGRRTAAKSNDGRARCDIRLPKPGDVLRRYYKGRAITVRVLESGFEYEGRRFRSLSAIAKVVTGAHWNGLLFFGIVHQER